MILFFTLLLFSLPASANSGISIGNGGQSLLCREEDGTESREAFDLFEGRVLFGYKVAFPESQPAIEIAMELATLLDYSQGGAFEEIDTIRGKLKYIEKNLRFLPPGAGLRPIGDSIEFVVPKNCEIVQTINFRDNFRIYVDTDAWNALPETSKAALYLHEAVYWQLRTGGVENDSRRTRRIVSYMMSGGALPLRAKIPLTNGSNLQYCRSKTVNKRKDWDTKFFAYLHNGKIVLQFLQLAGFRLLGRTEITTSAPFGTTHFPIQATTEFKIEGWVESPPDSEAFISLLSGGNKIEVSGSVQQGIKFEDEIECLEWQLSTEA